MCCVDFMCSGPLISPNPNPISITLIVSGSSEHVHYGAATLPLMRTSCLPEHTLQAACSFRVTHSAEGIDQPQVQRLHTHTHTVRYSFTSCLPNNVAHLAAADCEEAANYLSSSFTSSCTNSLCFKKFQ